MPSAAHRFVRARPSARLPAGPRRRRIATLRLRGSDGAQRLRPPGPPRRGVGGRAGTYIAATEAGRRGTLQTACSPENSLGPRARPLVIQQADPGPDRRPSATARDAPRTCRPMSTRRGIRCGSRSATTRNPAWLVQSEAGGVLGEHAGLQRPHAGGLGRGDIGLQPTPGRHRGRGGRVDVDAVLQHSRVDAAFGLPATPRPSRQSRPKGERDETVLRQMGMVPALQLGAMVSKTSVAGVQSGLVDRQHLLGVRAFHQLHNGPGSPCAAKVSPRERSRRAACRDVVGAAQLDIGQAAVVRAAAYWSVVSELVRHSTRSAPCGAVGVGERELGEHVTDPIRHRA